MLYTLAVVLLLMWAIGFLASFTLGGLIHLLLVLAIVAVAVQVVTGRRVV